MSKKPEPVATFPPGTPEAEPTSVGRLMGNPAGYRPSKARKVTDVSDEDVAEPRDKHRSVAED
jgi:hypothetical protein